MFGHVTGNDPRPHFFHQSNLADYNPALPETDPNQGGILYPVIDGLLARYEAAFDRSQRRCCSSTDDADRGRRSPSRPRGRHARRRQASRAWLQDGRVYVHNAGAAAVDVPLTGTTVGDALRRPAVRLGRRSPRARRRSSRPPTRPTRGPDGDAARRASARS